MGSLGTRPFLTRPRRGGPADNRWSWTSGAHGGGGSEASPPRSASRSLCCKRGRQARFRSAKGLPTCLAFDSGSPIRAAPASRSCCCTPTPAPARSGNRRSPRWRRPASGPSRSTAGGGAGAPRIRRPVPSPVTSLKIWIGLPISSRSIASTWLVWRAVGSWRSITRRGAASGSGASSSARAPAR